MGALDDLVSLLDLEQLEVNLFRGYSRDRDRVRLYGGEVLAQALMAAGRTVDAERRVHSMHAYFLKLGDPSHPFWEMKNPGRTAKTLSETAVNEALASIAEAAARRSS